MGVINYMGKEYSGSFIGLIDFFYPIGSYYETSDASFNPNVTWGGTWELETEGQVHVSAGSTYIIGNTGGSITSTVPTTKLSDAEMAHGHTYTRPTVSSSGTCSITSSGGHKHTVHTKFSNVVGYNSGTASVTDTSGNKVYDTSYIDANTGTHTHTVPNHTHTLTGGSVANLSGDSSTRMAHGHGSVSTLQPYIVTNRWHRTA